MGIDREGPMFHSKRDYMVLESEESETLGY